MKQPRRNTSIVALLVFATVAFLLALPATAAAQDPLRLSFVNAAKSGGDSAHETISEFLDASDDIETTPQKKVWDEAAELDLSEKDFRSSKKRDDNAREFRTIMKNLDIEALMILDVYSRGRKLQVVVIGPEGTEVADIRQDIRRGRISKSKARDVLKDAFGALVPEVKKFRDGGGWEAAEEEEEEEVADADLLPEEDLGDSDGDGDTDGEVSDKTVNASTGAFGELTPGYRIHVGALVGQRGLLVEGANEVNIQHESPFVGIGGRLTGIFSTFGEGNSAVGFSVFGGYAPFTTVIDGSAEIASEYARLGAQLEYHNMFGGKYGIELFGGAEATSVTLEKNENYTGNRYITARAGLNGVYIFDPVRLYVGGAVLPVFDTNNSDGAYGEAAFHLSFEANAGIGFGITDSISAMLGYTLQSFGPEYTEPQVRLTGPATSSDVMHTGLIAIGYAL
jgi:hypothetical protein